LKHYIFILTIILFSSVVLKAQENPEILIYNRATAGLGFGLDYGGIGANVTVYPQKNIGLFAGVGYAFAGLGYNAGVKLRLTPKKRFTPFFTAMYGYNTAVIVSNNSMYSFDNLSKLF
jgi:hypothetical protein